MFARERPSATLLDSWGLQSGVVLRKYEALRYDLDSRERLIFMIEGILPGTHGIHQSYWHNIHGLEWGIGEMDERHRYMQHPAYILLSNGKPIGGTWTDYTVRRGNAILAVFHISVQPQYRSRGLGREMLEIYENQMSSRGKWKGVECCWGDKLPDSHLPEFFAGHGYHIYGSPAVGRATKVLR